MTIEQAIECNKNLREYMRIIDKESKYKLPKENYEALEMAIKALEQQQNVHDTCKKCIEFSEFEQQPCEDYISREALDDAISELTYWHFENDRLMTGGGGTKSETVYKVDDVTRLTHILSPVTPQQRWIPVSERLLEEATNGDMIKAMFPDVDVKEKNNGYEVYFGVGTAIQFFNYQWWNAPYKAESEE